MGMLLRHRPRIDNLTTAENFGQPEKVEKPAEKKAEESTKDEKPRTVKRGRPAKY